VAGARAVAAAAAAEVVVRRKLWLAFAALGIVWGSTWVAADTLAESVPPLTGAVARFALAALLCFPIILWKRLPLPRGRPLLFVLGLSFPMIALPALLLLWAQPRVSSATVALLFAAMPLMLRPGSAPCIVAVGAIAYTVSASFSLAQVGGAAVTLLAVASIAFSVYLARRELREVKPVVLTALLLGAAALLLFLAALVLERGQPVEWNRGALASVIFLAAVGGAPAYATNFWLLQRLEGYQVVTLQWVQPLVAIAGSALYLRIGLSFNMVAGSLVTLFCLLRVLRARGEDDNYVSFSGIS
jgi:drug/metabolite transporter (DMT)-like permease